MNKKVYEALIEWDEEGNYILIPDNSEALFVFEELFGKEHVNPFL